MRTPPPRASVLDCVVDVLTFDETLARIDDLVQSGEPVQHCVVNASKLVLAREDVRLREIINSCAIVNADGQAVVWAARLLGVGLPERVAGIDLFIALLALADLRGYSVYFFGAREEVVTEVVRRARDGAADLRVAGYHNGYFDGPEDERAMIAEIGAARPDILFVGLPSPRKEFWLADHLDELGVAFAMGVGGSFDVVAGRVQRAPAWMQRAGLEWLYRFAQEPRRLWRRYLIGNLRFMALVARAAADRRRSRR